MHWNACCSLLTLMLDRTNMARGTWALLSNCVRNSSEPADTTIHDESQSEQSVTIELDTIQPSLSPSPSPSPSPLADGNDAFVSM